MRSRGPAPSPVKQPSQHLRGLLREVSGISAPGLSTGSGTESGIIAPQRKGVGSRPLCHLPRVCAAFQSSCPAFPRGLSWELLWSLGLGSAQPAASAGTCLHASRLAPLQQWNLAVNAGEVAEACRSPGLRLHPPIPLVSCGSGVRGQGNVVRPEDRPSGCFRCKVLAVRL